MSAEKILNSEFAEKAKSNFKKEIKKYDGKNFDAIITPLRNKAIKTKAKDMLIDETFSLEKAFESMPCNHDIYNKLNHKNCNRCKFNEREIWLETTLNELTGNEETEIKDKNGTSKPNQPLKKIQVIRGDLDDVIGINWVWG